MSKHTKSKTLFEESFTALSDKYINDADNKVISHLSELRQLNTEKTSKLLNYEKNDIQFIDVMFQALKKRNTYLEDMMKELKDLEEKVDKVEAIVDQIDGFTKELLKQ